MNVNPMDSFVSRQLDDGRWFDVMPLLFGRARLLVSTDLDRPLGFADDAWEYPTITAALEAFAMWDGADDPPDGWDRHPKSGRRRPEGDAAREHVHD